LSKLFFDLDVVKNIPHHKAMSDITDLLCHATGNVNREFFQAEVAYFLGLIPSSQRAQIISPERGNIPINIYSIALATSGFGKGHSVSILEDLISDFKKKFTNNTFLAIAEKSLFDFAIELAAIKGTDEQTELRELTTDFKRQGHAPFIFDSGTGPAAKQLRYKLLLAKAGSINFQMDEIGSNLLANDELLNIFLELYDLGRIKTKLVKNTQDNERGRDISGDTPANALLFGTTTKLFDGGKTENQFFSLLETGYARRCFFGVGMPVNVMANAKPEEVYDFLISKNKSNLHNSWKTRLGIFSDAKYHNTKITVSKPVGVKLVAYRLLCETIANNMPEHESIRKAEMSHRYFKALKLAGVYAFLDESPEITETHLLQAIKVTEESGESFQGLLKRERNFVRLAKYIAEAPDKLTHADLVEDLPYYPNSTVQRKEMMDLAIAWGVNNHIMITKETTQSVEFFSGSTLQETDLNKIMFSLSTDYASDYEPEKQPFNKLSNLLSAEGFHWCNHYFSGKHRSEDNTLEGFNLIAVDIDSGISLKDCHELLKDYTFITSTTKRHTDENNRFRLLIPTNYILNLNSKDYRVFMDNFLTWLPFESDRGANQASRKWLTNKDTKIHINNGVKLVNVLDFIPKTKQNSIYIKNIADLGNLTNLDRWFLNIMEENHNRNNTLIRYALMLKDAGASYKEVKSKTYDLNSKCKYPLKKEEIDNTILKSIAKKYSE
jgi:hypothetical protein